MRGDLVEQPRRVVEDMLAVVDDQQQLSRPQVLDDGVLDAESLLLLQAQRRGDGVRHRRRRPRAAPARRPIRRRRSGPALARRPRGRAWSCRRRPPRSGSPAGRRAARRVTRSTSCSRPTKLVDRDVADQPGPGAPRRGGHGFGRGVRRVAVEDLLVHGLQWRTRIDARARRPAVRASAGRCRVRRLAGRCGTGPASAVRPRRSSSGWQRTRRRQLAEQLGVPACPQRRVVAVQRGRKPLRFKRIPHIVEPRGVKRRERLAAPQIEGLSNSAAASAGSAARTSRDDHVAEAMQVHRHAHRSVST